MQTCWWPLSDHWSVQPISPHLSGFVFYGCLESLTELSALCMTSIRYIKGGLFFHYIIVMWQKHIHYCYFLMQDVFQNHCQSKSISRLLPLGKIQCSVISINHGYKKRILFLFKISKVPVQWRHINVKASQITVQGFFNGYFPGWPWWRHQVEIFSALLTLCVGNSPVPGIFSAQRPVTRSFDVFFDLRLNKPLSKQSWSWWFWDAIAPIMTSL